MNAKKKILIVDDDPDILIILEDRLESSGYQIFTADDGMKGLKIIKTKEINLILLDLKLPDMHGLKFVELIRKDHHEIPVVMMTAYGTVEEAVQAMKNGVEEFITKPFVPDHLELVFKRIFDQKNLEIKKDYYEEVIGEKYSHIIGTSKNFLNILSIAKLSAKSDSTVLLLGESGTGKEVFARSIHNWSNRENGPFVAINCASLSDELLESELFGYEKGAFTGAVKQKIGKVELAQGGTLFLDEIGEVKPSLQGNLLRLLENNEIERVGGTKKIYVDLRIISATNKNLLESVKKGSFRDDLYYRLNVITMSIPSLRDRDEDILLLANFFLNKFCKEFKKSKLKFSKEALIALKKYPWPGNIRELQNLVERSVVLSGDENTISKEKIFPNPLDDEPIDDTNSYHERVKNFKKKIIIASLKNSNQNQTKAAELLGLQRTYLSRLISQLGIKS